MIKKISHIGIAVKNAEETAKFLVETLYLKVESVENVEDQKVKVHSILIGETRIELLETTDPNGPIGKFIEKRGEGIHHIALEVNDLSGELQRLKDRGVSLIDEKPRKGANKLNIAFLHPKSTRGILLELCERSEEG